MNFRYLIQLLIRRQTRRIWLSMAMVIMISCPLIGLLFGSLYHLQFKPQSEISQIIGSSGFWGWLGAVLLITFYMLPYSLPFALFYGLIIAMVTVHFEFTVRIGFIFLLGMLLCLLWASNWASILFGLGEPPFRREVFLSCLPGHLVGTLMYVYFVRSRGKRDVDEI